MYMVMIFRFVNNCEKWYWLSLYIGCCGAIEHRQMVHDQDQGYPMLTPLCASCTRKGLQQEKEHARVRGTLVMEASGHLTRRLL